MLSDRTFKRKYRVSKRTFSEILEKIKPSIEGRPRDHRCFNGSAGKVDTDIKLACALRQLSGGSYLDVHSECGVSISTYYKAVWEVFTITTDDKAQLEGFDGTNKLVHSSRLKMYEAE